MTPDIPAIREAAEQNEASFREWHGTPEHLARHTGHDCQGCTMVRLHDALLAELGLLRAALEEATNMLAYLWEAEGLVDGYRVRDGFADADPIREDVPKAIEAAREALARREPGS